MNDQAFVVIPHPAVVGNHRNQILFPGTINQIPGMIGYSGQPLGIVYPGNQLPERTETSWNISLRCRAETKVFGAIQIMMGLIHIGFGSVLTLFTDVQISSTLRSGYVYWAGISFIASGCLQVATEKKRTSFLKQVSTGLNVVSTLVGTAGLIIFLLDEQPSPSYPGNVYLERRLFQGLLNVLLIFTILEFFIAVISTTFECEAIFSPEDEELHHVPDGVISNQGALLPIDPPPSYEADVNARYDTTPQAV